MSDSWLSVVTMTWADLADHEHRLKTTHRALGADRRLYIFWGDHPAGFRIIWPAEEAVGAGGYCGRLQAEFPDTAFGYVLAQAGEEFPLVPGVAPPQQSFGCA